MFHSQINKFLELFISELKKQYQHNPSIFGVRVLSIQLKPKN